MSDEDDLFHQYEVLAKGRNIMEVMTACMNIIARGCLLSSVTLDAALKMAAQVDLDIREIIRDNEQMLGEGVASMAEEGEHGAN